MQDGQWYRAPDGLWYQWPDPTPHDAPPGVPSDAPRRKRPWPLIFLAACLGVAGFTAAIGAALSRDPGRSSLPSGQSSPTTAGSPAASPPEVTEPSEAPSPPPAPPAKPSIYNGRGDDVVKIVKPAAGPVLLYIRGNAGSDYFGVDALDAGGQRISNQVNETEPYNGTTLLDVEDGQTTASLRIQATGSWYIEVRPLTMARRFDRTISGKNDDVVAFTTTEPGTAVIKGNAGGDYFGVDVYTTDGRENLVNTTDAYSGRVPWPAGPGFVVLQAQGSWSITVE